MRSTADIALCIQRRDFFASGLRPARRAADAAAAFRGTVCFPAACSLDGGVPAGFPPAGFAADPTGAGFAATGFGAFRRGFLRTDQPKWPMASPSAKYSPWE